MRKAMRSSRGTKPHVPEAAPSKPSAPEPTKSKGVILGKGVLGKPPK